MRRLIATATAVATLVAVPLIAGCGSSDSASTGADTAATGATGAEAGAAKTWSSAPKMAIDPKSTYTAVLRTSEGNITIALDPKTAPKTVNNFVFLSKEGFYDGLTFHRVVPGFVIQGGDPQGTGVGGPGFTVNTPPPGNFTFRNGDVAMAKAGNEPPGEAGSQFFIVSTEAGASQLEPLYAVVGHVVDDASAETLRRIDALGIDDGPPVEPVWIWTARLSEGG